MGILDKVTNALTPQLAPLREGAAAVNKALGGPPPAAAPPSAPAATPKAAPAPAASSNDSDLVARGYQKQPDGTWMKEMNVDNSGLTKEPIGGK